MLTVTTWFIATNDRRALVRDIDERRVVILPLDNRTGDSTFDALGVVAADWTTRLLTFFRHSVDVVPTTTTLAYHHSAQLAVHGLGERAELLAFGVRAQRVAWGTFYRIGDSLRFDVQVSDIVEEGPVKRVAQVIVPTADARLGADRVGRIVARTLLDVYSLQTAGAVQPPAIAAYQSFVTGLDAYAQKRYRSAAVHFDSAAALDTTYTFRVWLADALIRDRQYARAHSVVNQLLYRRLPVGDAERSFIAYARLRGDWWDVYLGGRTLVDRLPADDLAAFDWALAALALNRPREARTILREQYANRGALRNRPDYFLHFAAAHHLIGQHGPELRIARRALSLHHASVEARLASCRANAASDDTEDARVAVDLLGRADTRAAVGLSVSNALGDCAAELRAHDQAGLAQRADVLAAWWARREPATSALQRDSVYEQVYISFDSARVVATRGDAAHAMELLYKSIEEGLPYYEPGRMMLHAEPAFRRLRNTRGFLRLTQPRG